MEPSDASHNSVPLRFNTTTLQVPQIILLALKPSHVFTQILLAVTSLNVFPQIFLALKPSDVFPQITLAVKSLNVFPQILLAVKPFYAFPQNLLAVKSLKVYPQTIEVLALKPLLRVCFLRSKANGVLQRGLTHLSPAGGKPLALRLQARMARRLALIQSMSISNHLANPAWSMSTSIDLRLSGSRKSQA